MKTTPHLRAIKQAIRINMAANKVTDAYLFGSYARGEAQADSDVDIAVDMQADADLFDLIRFKQDVEKLLAVQVDVTTRRSLAPRLRPYVEADMISI